MYLQKNITIEKMIKQCLFYVDSSGGDRDFNTNSTYSNWNWILIRDSKTGNWKVDDWAIENIVININSNKF